MLFLNYSAVDPSSPTRNAASGISASTPCRHAHGSAHGRAPGRQRRQERCTSSARTTALARPCCAKAKKQLAAAPDVAIVGDELHPVGRVKDLRLRRQDQDQRRAGVVTGNWGNDLTLLVKAAREVGYRQLLHLLRQRPGRPCRHGRCGHWQGGGRGRLAAQRAGRQSEASTRPSASAFPSRRTTTCTCACSSWSRPWPSRSKAAGSVAWPPPWRADGKGPRATGRPQRQHARRRPPVPAAAGGGCDGQAGRAGVRFDVEGSGYGFRVVRDLPADKAQQPHSCQMQRY